MHLPCVTRDERRYKAPDRRLAKDRAFAEECGAINVLYSEPALTVQAGGVEFEV